MTYRKIMLSDEEVLVIHLSYKEEFARLDPSGIPGELISKIKMFIKEKGIRFNGRLVKVYVGSVLIGTLLLSGQYLDILEKGNIHLVSYTVERGDTLYTISDVTGLSIEQLKEINELVGDMIYPGQELLLREQVEISYYQVLIGDTIDDIALKYKMDVEDLKQLNGLVNPVILPGDTLKVLIPIDSPPDPDTSYYTIRSGDNLSKVATRHDMSVAQLMDLNYLTSDLIYPGQVLLIKPLKTDLFELSDYLVRVSRGGGRIDTLSLEAYIVGVVAAEIPASFHIEALKAQALAARTYATSYINSDKILTDTVRHQVYYDELQQRLKWGDEYEHYYQKVLYAVMSTASEVITYNGNAIDAVFFSTSNGKTEDPQFVWGNNIPYLKSVDSPWDHASRQYLVEKTMSYTEFVNRLGISGTKSLYAEVRSRTAGNGVNLINISGKIHTGVVVREKLDLRSTDFDIFFERGTVRIVQRGYGHRVGMSQSGAHYMGLEGYLYDDIIRYYYQGVYIEKLEP